MITNSACYDWRGSLRSPARCNASPLTEPGSSPSSQPLPAQIDFEIPLRVWEITPLETLQSDLIPVVAAL